jgi:hypothetical protein
MHPVFRRDDSLTAAPRSQEDASVNANAQAMEDFKETTRRLYARIYVRGRERRRSIRM